ncbi:hypothetical protein XYCOK13_30100 [Xylanibacillus composti]|uniref:Uncharacterized protein n=1 Tax=Xylanibacillus composti TaxID=1572762 RepID=A0A8J4H5Z7_9BACL|nr:hypothetical protein [Xylanibacillus composti]GIQ70186.1 hypothetical protein XYCOK13_30100 [Xylanibacillus composti]
MKKANMIARTGAAIAIAVMVLAAAGCGGEADPVIDDGPTPQNQEQIPDDGLMDPSMVP